MSEQKKIIELSLEDYNKRSSLVFDVMACGESFCIDTGDAGKFYVVREDNIPGLMSELMQRCRDDSAAALGLISKEG
jgi:hypothetical protein